MAFPIEHIIKIAKGKLLNLQCYPATITQLLIDSRQLISPKESLFFAFKGQSNDGHQYIAPLYKNGVRNFVVSQKVDLAVYPNANFILSKNLIKVLQRIAIAHRRHFQLPTIGITGSNGKTIIKEWLFQALKKDLKIVRSPKSYNSQIGVPLSVWQIHKSHELGIFEAGISQVKEMKNLAPIINPTIGILSNIGDAHDKGFKHKNQKIKEKLLLFKKAKVIIYRANNPTLNKIITKTFSKKKLLSWSRKKGSNIFIQKLEKKNNYTSISFEYENTQFNITIHFTNQAAIENCMHCIATMLHLGYSQKKIQNRVDLLEPVAMRLELKGGINGSTIINDSYNSDLNSIGIAFQFLTQKRLGRKGNLIISDILETNISTKKLYQKLAKMIDEQQIHRVIGIGDKIQYLQKELHPTIETQFYPDTATFLDKINLNAFNNQIILIKGARKFSFELIANRFAQQIHNTVLEINLGALVHNLNVYKQRLSSSTKIMAMVKASAYGSGSIEVARLLEGQKIDYLAVAFADEGVELRKAGIKTPILVLNPEKAVFDLMMEYELEPEIYNLSILKAYILSIKNRNKPNSGIHLKFDTGLKRLGFMEADISALIQILRENPSVKIQSVFSHLAASDANQHDDFTLQQIQLFEHMYTLIALALDIKPPKHILNSSGIVRFPQYQMNMVRLGIGLYGIDSSQIITPELQNVHSLKASISQIKYVEINETIGYNRKGKASKKMKLAIISIGYADGLMRLAGNGNFKVFLHDQLAPIVGNICMDMAMIDISKIPEAQEGDQVIIFGDEYPVYELAESCQTIPYEIFTNISDRVRRIYFQE